MSKTPETSTWKKEALEREVTLREQRRQRHPLSELLIELTDACNLRCKHCGSSCQRQGVYLEADAICDLVEEVAKTYDPNTMRIAFTGGEPMMHPSFWDITDFVVSRGFHSGMTTNGTFIGKTEAKCFAEIGFEVITISLDGMEKEHDAFRGVQGSWKKALRGIDCLLEAGIVPSITTVANSMNISQLDEMKSLLTDRGIQTWRILNIDPIGRALKNPELLLDANQQIAMWRYIEEGRINHVEGEPKTVASCAHYLGKLHELETRPWVFSCRSGVTVASITAKGEFVGCLDVERRPELVMGHLGQDSFIDTWENSYEPYRMSRAEISDVCTKCEHKRYCDGDSQHTWDYTHMRPRLCIGNV